MAISYRKVDTLDAKTFIDILQKSGLAERRPVNDAERIGRMLANANLIVVAEDTETGSIVGVVRALTDFAYCCYLSDLAVDRAYQKQGIGKRLIEETRRAAGPQSMCLLVSAPGAVSYYKAIGMPQTPNAFIYPREA